MTRRSIVLLVVLLAFLLAGLACKGEVTETCYLERVGSTASITIEGPQANDECKEIAATDPAIYVIGSISGGSVACEVELYGYTFTVRDTVAGGPEGKFLCRWIKSWK